MRTPEGVFVDTTGKAAGRGAYVHNTRSCWEKALKGPINHALRVELSEEDRLRLKEYVSHLPQEKATEGSPGLNDGSQPDQVD